MMHFKPAALGVALSLACSVAIAQEPADAQSAREELDASFGSAEQKAMEARYSDDIPPTRATATPSGLAAAAELVVVGTVDAVVFTHEGKNKEPFTNTTFRISQVLKGELTGGELKLKQRGGPSPDGRSVNIVSDTQHFQRGAEEILFLERENDQWHVKTRFAVDGGLLYDPDGFGVTMSEDGALGLSRERNTDPRFSTIDVGVDVLTKHFSDPTEAEPDYADGDLVEQAASADQEPVEVDKFIAAVRAI